ncbi:MAG: eukaryotic-like serine/threonine-protein kinase [Thermoleophilaceae bacterium]|nr:eukaryotic-like serine/threonine-protein kinase [Thermoleophilaceae bacterium]
MERPLIPDRAADDARTAALDERPTPRRNRRPRFGGRADEPRTPPPPEEDWYRTGATAALGGDEARYASPDDTRALPSEAGDWRQRQPSRQLVLDRYRLERRIGAGGFGVVWLAFDEKLEREVAGKVMPRDGEDPVSQRAEREARVAARLNHPGIVAMYELGADDEAVYLVSELVPGRTLAELTRAGAVSDRDIARIGVALCDALAHAHQRKVIHRDVKPQNVLVVDEPAAGAGFAKLADFGVAHLASGDPLTRTGDVVGTLAYMAPEQAEGDRVTPAADVYSLALMLYEGWTGTNPVRAGSPMGTARRLGTVLPPLRSRRRDLPAELGTTIDAALDPDPERRPTLRQLRTAIDAVDRDLSNEGGLVEPGTLERLGLRRDRGPLSPRGMRWPDARVLLLAGRFGAGVAAGGLAVAALQLPPAAAPVNPLAFGTVVAIAVMLLPRIAWLATVAALVVWFVLPGTGMQGAALVLLVATVPVVLLLPRAGLLWSLPALAPLLGAAALGPLFIVVAGFATTAWRRAGLAAAGLLWLAFAEIASGRTLLFGPAPGSTSHHEWERSIGAAGDHALAPLVTSAALLPAVAWAVLAVLLPVVVRGRSLTLDLLGAILWTAGLIAAHQSIGRLLSDHGQDMDARGLAAGALLAAVAAVAAAGSGLWHAPRAAPGVPRMAAR